MLSLLLLQTGSLLTQPLYLDEEPPELRSVRTVQVLHEDAEGAGPEVTRTLEEALARAAEVATRARAGEGMAELAAKFSDAPQPERAGVLGTFAPGMLTDTMDAFLFTAEPGEVSDPIAHPSGVHVLERIDTYAGVRVLRIAGDDEASLRRARELAARAAQGEDFEELAREHSDDPALAARGGAYAVFERGPRDRLLKAAVFEVPVGAVAGPIVVPFDGTYVAKRVPPEELDPALRESTWVRLRAILVQHDLAEGADPAVAPSQRAAFEEAQELHARLAAGEDLLALAREHTDDPGGRERAGDLGWIHRGTPGLHFTVRGLLKLEPGELSPVTNTPFGYVIARRER